MLFQAAIQATNINTYIEPIVYVIFIIIFIFGLFHFLNEQHTGQALTHPYNTYYAPTSTYTAPINRETIENLVSEINQRTQRVEHQHETLNAINIEQPEIKELKKNTLDKLKDEHTGLLQQLAKLQHISPDAIAQRATLAQVNTYLYEQNGRFKQIEIIIKKVNETARQQVEHKEPEKPTIIPARVEPAESETLNRLNEDLQKLATEIDERGRNLYDFGNAFEELKEEIDELHDYLESVKTEKTIQLIRIITKLSDSIEETLRKLEKDKILATATLTTAKEAFASTQLSLQQRQEFFSTLKRKSETLREYQSKDYPKVIQGLNKQIERLEKLVDPLKKTLDPTIADYLDKKIQEFKKRIPELLTFFK